MSLMKSVMVVAGTAFVLGSGQAWITQTNAAQEKTASAAQKSEATGIAECDKYFAMVSSCVATRKMSTEEQQAAELNVSRLRAMLPIAASPQGQATLTQRCTASIEIGQKNDKYGCYKTENKAGRGK